MTPRHRPLTANMRAALNAARSQPLRRVHDDGPGCPPWPAKPGTLYGLWRRGLVVGSCRVSRRGQRLEEWTITDTGREALRPAPILRRDTVRRLHVAGCSTRMMQLGAWVDVRMPEPEPVAA